VCRANRIWRLDLNHFVLFCADLLSARGNLYWRQRSILWRGVPTKSLHKFVFLYVIVLISVQFCGKCGFKHADSSLRTAFCTQCGTARFITDLRINREQLVSAAINKIVDAPDQAQMIDAAPTNSHRSVNSAGDPVDVYPECTPFTVALEAKWLWTNVLQRDESAKDRVCFRDKSHEHLIRQLAAQLHPQLALACQDSWISSPTTAIPASVVDYHGIGVRRSNLDQEILLPGAQLSHDNGDEVLRASRRR
jgi:hypothetical protein